MAMLRQGEAPSQAVLCVDIDGNHTPQVAQQSMQGYRAVWTSRIQQTKRMRVLRDIASYLLPFYRFYQLAHS